MDMSRGFIAERHSITRPPFFDGSNYSYWKNRMQVFLRAQDYELWRIVERGLMDLPEDEDSWTREQIRRATMNWSAMNMMQCTIHPKEYSRVSSCKFAKEMWEKLQLIYEGTSEVREIKTSMLILEYEMFKMMSNETISEMFARFMLIVNYLKGFGKEYSNGDLIRKILRSLPPAWHTKATVIEDSKSLLVMQLDELIGSLMTYEINLKRNTSELNLKKPLALKATSSIKMDSDTDSDTNDSSDDEKDDEIVLLTRQFRKIL